MSGTRYIYISSPDRAVSSAELEKVKHEPVEPQPTKNHWVEQAQPKFCQDNLLRFEGQFKVCHIQKKPGWPAQPRADFQPKTICLSLLTGNSDFPQSVAGRVVLDSWAVPFQQYPHERTLAGEDACVCTADRSNVSPGRGSSA